MNRVRYWLADLISGGELTFQTEGWKWVNARYLDEKDLAFNRGVQLARIAALETICANATVRKMAKIARGEA